jgi:hypothetical protein
MGTNVDMEGGRAVSGDGNKRIVIGGSEYGSVEDMPPELRRVYEVALKASQTAADVPKIKVVFAGKEYDGVDSMPPEVRKQYEHQQAAMETFRDFSVDATTPRAAKAPGSATATGKTGPGRFNWLLIGGALLAVALIVFILAKL